MELKNLECQLTMAQVRRYLAGARLSDEAVEALEGHLRECTECRTRVQFQQKNPAPATTQKAVVSMPVSEPDSEPEMPAKTPVGMSPLAIPIAKKLGHMGGNKPLWLSVFLAAVLITMSQFASQPTRIFGERASASLLASTAKVDKKPALTPEPEKVVKSAVAERTSDQNSESKEKADSRPEVSKTVPTEPKSENPETNIPQPVVDSPARTTAKPRTTRKRPIVTKKRSVPQNTTATKRRVSTPKPALKKTSAPAKSGVKVYDENGNPL